MARRSDLTTPACALALAVAWLVGPIARAGAWDPVEADAADHARRIAVRLFGAAGLARAGDPAAGPTLSDLKMGELPYTAMALSFKWFGFHEWAGRLPLALVGLAGALSLYAMLHRLVHPRAGFFALVALVATPLYFMHARTMAGDIVAMSAFVMACSGAALGLADPSPRARLAGLALAALGLVGGFMSRGALLGVASPCAAVAAAALVARPRASSRAMELAITIIVGAIGVGAAVAFFVAVRGAGVGMEGAPLRRVVGMPLFDPSPSTATFDRLVRHIGHAMFPWSAVVPVALGRLLIAPAARAEADETEEAARASFVKMLLLLGAGCSFLAGTLVVPWAGVVPYAGVGMLAGAIGLMAFEMRDTRPSALEALTIAFALLVLAVDLDRMPSRSLAVFAVEAAAFPVTFTEPAKAMLAPVAGLFGFLAFFAHLDGATGSALSRSTIGGELRAWVVARRASARDIGGTLYRAFDGNLVFACVLVEAALVGLGAMLAIGSRAGWSAVAKLPQGAVKVGVTAWWAAPLGLTLAAVGFVLARDALRAGRRLLGWSRGALVIVAGAAAGAVLGFFYYPALGEQLSPRGAFEVYARARGENEPLALLGTSPRAGALYFREPLPSFEDVGRAATWLGQDDVPRRFLILKSKDLPRLNSLWRARFHRSVSVVDARSRENVLVASAAAGETLGEDPFADILFDAPPPVAHALSARFLDHLEVLGWEIVDESNRPTDVVVPDRTYRARFVYRVLRRVPGSWQSFLHIDGNGKRYNADHPPLGGRYAMTLWQPGDIVRDEVDVKLEPNFTPGEYWVFFGFFQGEARLHVSDGPARDDRVIAGRITVR